MLCDRCHDNEAATYMDCAHICLDCHGQLKADRAWVDNSPTYSAVLAARDEKHPTRTVPRLREQKPWRGVTPDLMDRTSVSCSGKDITIVCDDHDSKDALMDILTGACVDVKGVRPESLNAFAADFHASNQHWWHDPATGNRLDRNMGEMLMLVVSEIAECMEGERKDLMDDHLPHRKMAEVELADAVIRIADIAGAKGFNLEAEFRWPHKLTDNKGESLLLISTCITDAFELLTGSGELTAVSLSEAVALIEAYAEKHSYDLWGAVFEKMEYNKHRADHKPEARLAANGKKF